MNKSKAIALAFVLTLSVPAAHGWAQDDIVSEAPSADVRTAADAIFASIAALGDDPDALAIQAAIINGLTGADLTAEEERAVLDLIAAETDDLTILTAVTAVRQQIPPTDAGYVSGGDPVAGSDDGPVDLTVPGAPPPARGGGSDY